ncbi:MAG: TolC family protein [Hydrogenophaga sp.]|uniref:TolC family protein n=1 Tax=Hydrogenophaga sp. TaxID=1904254 RepID=UPI0026214C4C|nr:TolC family protein [Hydrogenophaga sp.]MDM7942376.1 TolC family protein [Hydrogenophaga sp.]
MHLDTRRSDPRAIQQPDTIRSTRLVKPALGLLAALISMACSAQTGSAALTLEDALRISAIEHPSVLARRSERRAADATLDVAERQKYPNLSFQSTGDSFGGRANTVRLEQPLWLGGRIKAGVDSARASIQQADAGVLQAQMDIMLKVVASFTELGRIQARQVAARSNVEEHARLARMIQRRVDSEISPASDSTLATARFSQARAELNQLDSLAVRARSTLGQAIGKSVGGIELPVQRDLFPYTLDRMIQAALDYAPSIRRLEGETQAATAEIHARRSDVLPQLKLRLDRTQSRSTSNTQVYVALDVQTGAGMSVQASVREAEARKDALQSQIDAVRRETIDAVSADWADLTSFSEQARDLQKQVETTTSVFDSFVRQYAVGRKGWNDVLNSQREVAQARFQLADATWGELRASMRLHLLTGLITGEHVALSGPTLLDGALAPAKPASSLESPAASAAAVNEPAAAGAAPVSPVQSMWQRITEVAPPAAPVVEPPVAPAMAADVPTAPLINPSDSRADTRDAPAPDSTPAPLATAPEREGSARPPATPDAPRVSPWDLIILPTPRPQLGAMTSPVPTIVVAESPIESSTSVSNDRPVEPETTAPATSPR